MSSGSSTLNKSIALIISAILILQERFRERRVNLPHPQTPSRTHPWRWRDTHRELVRDSLCRPTPQTSQTVVIIWSFVIRG
jgi:hypothetical protein